jgi:putative endonuclease
MYFVYVLKNVRTSRRYVGYTSDIKRRIDQHNSSRFNPKGYTKRISGPWKLVYKEEYFTRAKAMRREKFLKSGQGREWLKNLST